MTDDLRRPKYDDLPHLEGTTLPSAWGQYGEGDELGAVNLLTPERVRAASAECVRTGERFVLQLPLHLPDPPFFGREPLHHEIFATPPTGTDDKLDNFYPQASTQWDGLGHFVYPPTEQFYNGFTYQDVLEGRHLGIDQPAARGIVGRGVLADVPRYLEQQGRPLAPDQTFSIDADLLQATLDHQGTTLRPGDVLCVRTGWLGHYKSLDADGRREVSEASHRLAFGAPGLAPADGIARLVWDNGIVALAVDNPGVEPSPPPMAPAGGPDYDNICHTRVMVLLGVHLGEFFDLDDLAAACAVDGRYEFLLVSAPLRITGGAGSPPNAVAIR
jgi:kynurenine formamidase